MRTGSCPFARNARSSASTVSIESNSSNASPCAAASEGLRLYVRPARTLFDVDPARRFAHRLRLEAIGRAVQQPRHPTLVRALALGATVALMRLRRHVIVPSDDAFEIAIDD